MERSLDLGLLTAALSGRTGVPTAEQLQDLMGQMEVGLFLRRAELNQQMLEAAWYLHAVASVDRARDRYTPERQRQAFQVSAHIFDLALQQDGWTAQQQLSLGFAAAIGYRRGGRDPNATAIMNRLRNVIIIDPPVAGHVETLPLEAGLAFLGFQPRQVTGWFRTWRRQLDALARESALNDLGPSVLGPAQLIVLAADDLLAYFTNGTTGRLARGRARLLRVIGEDGVPEDVDARWVAAHLLALSDEAFAGSLWNPNVIPPEVPPLVRQAFTIGTPAVVTLWEPQRDLLTGTQSPFDPEIRRMVLSVPTSGGKTLLAQLLATEQLERTGTAVCYVAPTRSLCREVRQAMSSRVRILQKEAGTDKPDFPFGSFTIADILDDGPPPDVEVMTPERLANLLRHDADGVLARFGMFIFDEAQHLKESGRGFVLESTIAMLDYLSGDTEHCLVLISAAMGNAGAIAQWIDPDGGALVHESSWRGPRRLHAVFTTEAHFDQTTVEHRPRAPRWPFRHSTPLGGLIRLRLADGKTESLRTRDDTGWRLVRKATSGDQYPAETQKDSDESTRQYQIASEMIEALGHAGSVLVVATTRAQAQQVAGALADGLSELPALTPIVDFIQGQLGPDHPLIGTLRRGVAFHHAGLPTEVQETLEQAVRDDILPYLTCTSTLTDGINLPVRTVVIYDQGAYEGQPDDVRLRGARLVNAIGRAGRAGKETEGWIVLTRAAAPSENDFTDLNPDAETLAVTSSLTTDDALHELAAFEAAARDDEDAIFRAAGPAATNFIGFVWMMLATEEGRGVSPDDVDIAAIVDATLAAQTTNARPQFMTVAEVVRNRYRAADSAARRRWPRTGTSIGSARTIDDLADSLVTTLVERAAQGLTDNRAEPDFLLSSPGVLQTLLGLSEAPRWKFSTTTARGADITVDPAAVLRDWLAGIPLAELGDAHLAAAGAAAWRVEQIVDAVTSHFEHFLSWTVSAVVELVNVRLSLRGIDDLVCPELGGYIRYGINEPNALILMTSGIRSRRLAHAISGDLPDDFDSNAENLRSHLAAMGVTEWRDHFAATASELLDLLEFARVRRRSLLRALLESGTVDVELPATIALGTTLDRLALEPVRDAPPPAPLAVYAADDQVATVASQDQADLTEILNTGVGTRLTVNPDSKPPTLTIALTIGDGE